MKTRYSERPHVFSRKVLSEICLNISPLFMILTNKYAFLLKNGLCQSGSFISKFDLENWTKIDPCLWRIFDPFLSTPKCPFTADLQDLLSLLIKVTSGACSVKLRGKFDFENWNKIDQNYGVKSMLMEDFYPLLSIPKCPLTADFLPRFPFFPYNVTFGVFSVKMEKKI